MRKGSKGGGRSRELRLQANCGSGTARRYWDSFCSGQVNGLIRFGVGLHSYLLVLSRWVIKYVKRLQGSKSAFRIYV